MIKANILKNIGLYSLKFKAAEDYELFFRITKQYKVANIPEILMQFEVGDVNSISVSKRNRQLRSKLKVQICYFDFRNIYSYLGVIKTVILLLTPRKLIVLIKTIMKTAS